MLSKSLLVLRCFSTDLKALLSENIPLAKIRNLGIIAHIDAGKTTTTERMLYYAGVTKRIGNVDDGNTVMDYMDQERERGITITSATITFPWKDFKLNLIDTPGHVDFTMEVQRSLRVVDAAVIIVDARKGLEAQSETVWKQALHLPKLIFINKFDKEDCFFAETMKNIKRKGKFIQDSKIIALQVPILRDDWREGVKVEERILVDLLDLSLLQWTDKDGDHVIKTTFQDWFPSKTDLLTNAFFERLNAFWQELYECICETDDQLMLTYLNHQWTFSDSAQDIQNALSHFDIPGKLIPCIRGMTLDKKMIPVFVGAAYKNWGVQPLLDGITSYLPSPADVPLPVEVKKPSEFAALAFKVLVDQQRGPMVFVRVYAGTLHSRMAVYNSTRKITERVSKVISMLADDAIDIPAISTGNIGVLLGLKDTCTGDTLVIQSENKSLVLDGIPIPPAVFFCSVEPESPSADVQLQHALKALALEDPSFHIQKSEETGQLLMAGMGELHLEILKNRILRDYHCKVTFGQMKIAYRESMHDGTELTGSLSLNQEVLGKKLHIALEMSIGKQQDSDIYLKNTISVMDSVFENQEFFPNDELMSAIESAVHDNLQRGPVLGMPLIGLHVTLHSLTLFPDTTLPSIHAAMNQLFRQSFFAPEKYEILEPIMDVSIRTRDDSLGNVLSDISSSRRGNIQSLASEDDDITDVSLDTKYHIIHAEIPLKELIGYSSALRAQSAGTGTFDMTMKGFRALPLSKQSDIIREYRGY